MTFRDDALAKLAEGVARELLVFAERLRAGAEPTAAGSSPGGTTRRADPAAGLGSAQLAVLAAVRDAGVSGVTSHEVAKVTGQKNTNTPRILKTLAERGLVDASETRPVVWTAT